LLLIRRLLNLAIPILPILVRQEELGESAGEVAEVAEPVQGIDWRLLGR
jgi:hypothetical protein